MEPDVQQQYPDLAEEHASGPSAERQIALTRCFQHLDVDGSGYIELSELRALATQVTPKANLEDTLTLLKGFDTDQDRKVSLQEFLNIMGALAEPMSEEEFEGHVSTLLGRRPEQALNEPGYQHPAGCREYLVHQVVPALRDGLRGLVAAVQASKLEVAGGRLWVASKDLGLVKAPGANQAGAGAVGPEGAAGQAPEAGQAAPGKGAAPAPAGEPEKFLPRGWEPFSPLRWLGEYLMAQLPPESRGGMGGVHDGPAHPPSKSFEELSRAEKCELAFAHLDRDGSGFLDSHELLAVAGKLRKEQDIAYAEELLKSMDIDRNGRVELPEYVEFVMQLTQVLTDAEFDAAIHKLMGAGHLSYCTSRADKLRFLFHELDQDRSGTLTADEITALAHRIDPDASPWKIQATLDFLDRDGSNSVDVEEFVDCMGRLIAKLGLTGSGAPAAGAADSHSDHGHGAAAGRGHDGNMGGPGGKELDDLIVKLLEGRKYGSLTSRDDPCDEVEPLRFQELCRALPTLQYTVQMGTTEVLDSVAGNTGRMLLIIDVRAEEEWAVSAIPTALHLPVQEDECAQYNWSLGDLTPLRHRLQELMVTNGGPPRVVAYCNTGQRSAAASILLTEKMGMPVRCLVGGIINYYNQGGRVREPGPPSPAVGVDGEGVLLPLASGREVQAVHPGHPLDVMRAFVTRPNNYKGGGFEH